jgi:hypothetical protein
MATHAWGLISIGAGVVMGVLGLWMLNYPTTQEYLFIGGLLTILIGFVLLIWPSVIRISSKRRLSGIEFFPNRNSLVRAHGTLGERLSSARNASAIFVTGQNYYDSENNTHVIKKLLLPNPTGNSFLFHMSVGPQNMLADTMIQRITEIAKRNGARVRWCDHFLFHSEILADVDQPKGWVHIESMFPYAKADQRPSYTIYKQSFEKTVQEAQRIFDEIWDKSGPDR